MAEHRNNNFKKAKAAKNDEFYTQLSDIENELQHYKEQFKNKVVYCNCDDPRVSNFFNYFYCNFEKLGLKKLITACYKDQSVGLFGENKPEKAIYLEYNGDKMPNIEEIGIKHLQGDGDFRSKESIELLKQADIVVTNPPFSLFREYVAQLIEHDKKFLILGNKNAITYKEVFNLFKANKMRVGVTPISTDMLFDVPTDYSKILTKTKKEGSSYKIINGKVKARTPSIWFTNIDNGKNHEDIILYKTYKGNESEYPKYDNYDVININRLVDIPMDYKGVMGVPITFVEKFNPDQFEIIKYRQGNDEKDLSINGKPTYIRILIKNKRL